MGFYIMGKYTSISWCATLEEAKHVSDYMKYQGIEVTIEPGDDSLPIPWSELNK